MADRARLTSQGTGRPIAIFMVRHAETAWVVEDRFQGRADTRLSPRGEAQAQALGRRLAEAVAHRQADPAAPPSVPIPAGPPLGIWHSPLERAAATARAIAEARGRADLLAALPDLIELHVGDWEGLTNAEVGQRWPADLAAWRRDPTQGSIPGGEPAAEAVLRVRRGLDAVIGALESAPDGGPSWGIVVSHDGFLRIGLLSLLELPLQRYWSFPMPAAGITVVDRLPDGPWRLRLHGWSAALLPRDGPGT